MKISIVTPSFNQALYLEEMLRSVQSQSYDNVEHITVDGASSDGSVAILQAAQGPAWSHLHWSSQPDNGQSAALNQGFQRASGDIIGWLNSDDRYRPGCLQTVANTFARNPEIDILYGDYTLIDACGRYLRTRREIGFNRFILVHHRILYIPTTSTFFRRKIFDDGNWLNESLHYAMDHEFYARLATKGYRFHHLSAVLADFRVHPESKSCRLPGRQASESRDMMCLYSPVLRHLKNGRLLSICSGLLRLTAACLRYSQKLLRGYYTSGFVTWGSHSASTPPLAIPTGITNPGER